MIDVLLLLCVQIAVGAFDNLWHHEISEGLTRRPSARHELALHATREAIYAVLFIGIAWFRWNGVWRSALAALLLVEIGGPFADFVVEDRTRRLPPLERIIHALLAINFGAILALWAPVLIDWAEQPTGFTEVTYGRHRAISWFLT